MQLQLEFIGALLLVLALLHAGFAWYFDWRREFAVVSLINRQMMYVHTFFIALAVGLIGLLCLTSAAELVGTPLGRRVALGLGIFWLARLLTQFFGYSAALWRGKQFETIVHVLFSLLWTYLAVVFFRVGLSELVSF
ncbi:hypothetical protein GKZ68_08925 [Hymenobacter sp. BRD128]|uniref:hypothetical protein n=1 Tax=Hymenobacter sp. BRD128 TaxID=2675878 RepID=UPI001567165A|nr:hypothetical protein [Hymenobacter sp. BRD128]QKG56733.1 hypothetical protein GKZ68_08925 [Hymenobacter sp. BRD128]